jgi:hypothetical protein
MQEIGDNQMHQESRREVGIVLFKIIMYLFLHMQYQFIIRLRVGFDFF